MQKETVEEFSAKRVLVTGGTRGIGEALVKRFRQGGGNVMTTGRSLPTGDASDQLYKPM